MRAQLDALLAVVAVVLPASSGCPEIDVARSCRHREERRASLPAESVRTVEVRALAGSLDVTGASSAATVLAEGTACGRRRADIEEVDVTMRADGDRVIVEASIPERAQRRGARLDLRITVPADVDLIVRDSSGDVAIEGVASVDLDDGSGDVRLRSIRGAAAIADRSGEIEVEGVGGAVRIDDASGNVDVSRAASVEVLSDGSGDLDIEEIAGDVTIHDDGSGDIEVDGVGGGLRVGDAGSGNVDHEDVRGDVEISD
jgi:hypothetical protein